MQQLNKVELKGVVGRIFLQTVGEKRMARFALATNYTYRSADGETYIETTWHNVVAFESEKIRDLDEIGNGTYLHVTGRIRVQRFTGADRVERTSTEIVASELNLIPDQEPETSQPRTTAEEVQKAVDKVRRQLIDVLWEEVDGKGTDLENCQCAAIALEDEAVINDFFRVYKKDGEVRVEYKDRYGQYEDSAELFSVDELTEIVHAVLKAKSRGPEE